MIIYLYLYLSICISIYIYIYRHITHKYKIRKTAVQGRLKLKLLNNSERWKADQKAGRNHWDFGIFRMDDVWWCCDVAMRSVTFDYPKKCRLFQVDESLHLFSGFYFPGENNRCNQQFDRYVWSWVDFTFKKYGNSSPKRWTRMTQSRMGQLELELTSWLTWARINQLTSTNINQPQSW